MTCWNDALNAAASTADESVGAVVISLDWADAPAHDAVSLVDGKGVAALVGECVRSMLPGAHLAMWVRASSVDAGGLALRLAGLEIRDTIATAHEGVISYWVLCRKPLGRASVVESTLARGTGGINIGATRVSAAATAQSADREGTGESASSVPEGRFSPNLLLDSRAVTEMDRQAPRAGAGGPASGPTFSGESKSQSMAGRFLGMGDRPAAFHSDSGGASRFFPLVSEGAQGVFGSEWVERLITTPAAPTLVLSAGPSTSM